MSKSIAVGASWRRHATVVVVAALGGLLSVLLLSRDPAPKAGMDRLCGAWRFRMHDALIDTEEQYAAWRTKVKPRARLDAALRALKATELSDFELFIGESGRARFRFLERDEGWSNGSWRFAQDSAEAVLFAFTMERDTGMVPPSSMMLEWRDGLLWFALPELLHIPLRYVGIAGDASRTASD